MIEIRNLRFQPLTFHLSGSGTLHLGPREKKSIARKDLSREIEHAAKRGLVSLSDLGGELPGAAEKGPSAPETGNEGQHPPHKRRK